MPPWAPGTSGASRRKQTMATAASPPGSGTRSRSRIIRAWVSSPRAATMTNFVPHAASPSPSKCRRASGSWRTALTSPVLRSTRVSPGLARYSGATTLPSAYSIRDRWGWVHDPGPSGSRRPISRAFQDLGARKVPVPAVQVVVAPHWLAGQVLGRVVRETAPDQPAHEPPRKGVGELGLHLPAAPVHPEQGVEHQEHEIRVVPGTAAVLRGWSRNELGEGVDGLVAKEGLDPLEGRHAGGAAH